MDKYMDNFKLHDVLNKALVLSFEERNELYFKIKAAIDDLSSDEAARMILSKIVDLLAISKTNIENKLLTENNELSDSNREVERNGTVCLEDLRLLRISIVSF